MSHETICPACNAVWGIGEIDFQECDSCGYPDCGKGFMDEDDIEDIFLSEHDDDFDDEFSRGSLDY